MAVSGRAVTVDKQAPLALVEAWLRQADVPQWLLLGYGFLPILSLSLALQGLVSLHLAAELVVIPATLGIVAVGLRWRERGRRALAGLFAGLLAVAVYDLVRLSFVVAGVMGDPIPNIGRMALDDPHASWVWGYAWRFVWNGGTMGVGFAMLPLRGWRQGVGFGLFVCACLFATLSASHLARERFLSFTALNLAVMVVGHIVYGATLGWTLERLERKLSAP